MAHICDLLYICILCHCSHFYSVGEQHCLILLVSTTSLSILLNFLLSSRSLSTLYSWCGEKIKSPCIKGIWMAQFHFSPMNSSVLGWRIMRQKNKMKVMHNHIICLPAKQFSKMARCMQFITYKVHHSYL